MLGVGRAWSRLAVAHPLVLGCHSWVGVLAVDGCVLGGRRALAECSFQKMNAGAEKTGSRHSCDPVSCDKVAAGRTESVFWGMCECEAVTEAGSPVGGEPLAP